MSTTHTRGVLYATLCDKVCQLLATFQWFSPGTLGSSANKTDRYDITEILLKGALNTITLILTRLTRGGGRTDSYNKMISVYTSTIGRYHETLTLELGVYEPTHASGVMLEIKSKPLTC